MKPFAFVEPDSLGKASEILAREAGRARVLAGGVDLLGEMKEGLAAPDTLVNIKAVPGLDGVRFDADGTLRIGALTTLATVAEHARVRREFPAIAQAALSVGSPEIRNVGTVGGNLCQRPRCWYYRSALHPCIKKGGDTCFTLNGESRYNAILGGGPSYIVHPSDLAPALIACEARVVVQGPDGRKDLPLEQFYVLPSVRVDHETILKAGDIVTEVVVPASASMVVYAAGPDAAASRSAFLKFKEKDSMDFALVSVAASIKMRGGSCAAARVVLGGVAPVPWRAKEAEAAILGTSIDAPGAARAAGAALAAAVPLAHNAYKIPLAKSLIVTVLLGLAAAGPDLVPA